MIPKYKRILLKLSGESLMGDNNFGLDSKIISRYAEDILAITEMGVNASIRLPASACVNLLLDGIQPVLELGKLQMIIRGIVFYVLNVMA